MSGLGEANGKKCPPVAKNVKNFKNGVRKSSRNTMVAQPNKVFYISQISEENCVRNAAKPPKNQNF